MTEDEIIDVVTHFKNGGEVQYLHRGHWCVVDAPIWNFADTKYRKKPEKKTRLMTAEELKGKWIKRGEHSQMVIAIVDDEIETVTQGPKTVKKFHENNGPLKMVYL